MQAVLVCEVKAAVAAAAGTVWAAEAVTVEKGTVAEGAAMEAEGDLVVATVRVPMAEGDTDMAPTVRAMEASAG